MYYATKALVNVSLVPDLKSTVKRLLRKTLVFFHVNFLKSKIISIYLVYEMLAMSAS